MGLYAPPALKLSPSFSWPHEHCQLLPLPVLGHPHPQSRLDPKWDLKKERPGAQLA